MTALTEFIHDTSRSDLSDEVIEFARRALLDTLGVAAAGSQTRLASIIREHAVSQFGTSGSTARMLFDGRPVSPAGAALAGGMQIDSVDAHDGHKLTKGHVGCGVIPATLAVAEFTGSVSESELLTTLVIGYEVGTRAGIALHQEACDYHTSGAWISLATAALSSRLLGQTSEQTLEALGIAEYHGPRSQMMRVIDHPTMLKDGSGWGSMAGVSAAFLAGNGFTGAPALTTQASSVQPLWDDLGVKWFVGDQYIKMYPVCRWAQPAIVAALALKKAHAIQHNHIKRIVIGTFHESKRLAMRMPSTTEQAQYSLPFPVASALVNGDVAVRHIDGDALRDERVIRLSNLIEMEEVDAFNDVFPGRRCSSVTIEMDDGTVHTSGETEAIGDPEKPLADAELRDKFDRLTEPVLGELRAQFLKENILSFGDKEDLAGLNALIYAPAEGLATHMNSADQLFGDVL